MRPLPKFFALVLAAFVVIALPACSPSQDGGRGVSGGLYYYDEDLGAKAGLEYEDGKGRIYGRKDFRHPVTGDLISRAEIEKRFGKEPLVNPSK